MLIVETVILNDKKFFLRGHFKEPSDFDEEILDPTVTGKFS